MENNFSVWRECVSCRRLFFLAVLVAVFGSGIVSFCIPDTFVSRAKVSIDTNDKNPLEKGNMLQNIKNMLSSSESNVLTEPRVYLQVVNSSTFIDGLKTVTVDASDGGCMTFADYLLHKERRPWWSSGENVEELIAGHVKYEMNTHNKLITIQVSADDAKIACAMVDSVISHLHAFMSTYMLDKARVNYRNKLVLRKKAGADYHKAMRAKADFDDANTDVSLPDVATRQKDLQDEADRTLGLYNDAILNAEMAKMEMQRTRPTFIKLVANTAPLKPLNPHWVANFLIWLFYSVLCAFLLVLYRKKYFSNKGLKNN